MTTGLSRTRTYTDWCTQIDRKLWDGLGFVWLKERKEDNWDVVFIPWSPWQGSAKKELLYKLSECLLCELLEPRSRKFNAVPRTRLDEVRSLKLVNNVKPDKSHPLQPPTCSIQTTIGGLSYREKSWLCRYRSKSSRAVELRRSIH